MHTPFSELKKSDVQRGLDFNKERIRAVTLKAIQFLSDPDKKTRREKQYCICCFYKGSTMAGQACTESFCGLCEKEMHWSTTHQEKLCLDCAKEWRLCRECGSTLETTEPRWINKESFKK